jgi:SNF2 family DNA or RNA helicase
MWNPKILALRKYARQIDSEFSSFCIYRTSYEIIRETKSAILLLDVFSLSHFDWILGSAIELRKMA